MTERVPITTPLKKKSVKPQRRRASFDEDNLVFVAKPKKDIILNDLHNVKKEESNVLETESEAEESLIEVKSQYISRNLIEPLLSERSLSSSFDDEDQTVMNWNLGKSQKLDSDTESE